MKLLILIFAVCFITAIEGRNCYSSANDSPPENIPCKTGVDYCLQINSKIKGNSYKYQGCGDYDNTDHGMPKACTEPGIKTLSDSDVTGQYYCCNDADLCNNKTTLDPNASNNPSGASKPYVFGLIFLSIIVALFC